MTHPDSTPVLLPPDLTAAVWVATQLTVAGIKAGRGASLAASDATAATRLIMDELGPKPPSPPSDS